MTNQAFPHSNASAVPAVFGARRGLAIGLRPCAEGFVYRISLMGDQQKTAALHETADESEAVAIWRRCASEFGLPRFIERAPDDFVMVEARMGALAVRPRKPRRRGSPLIGRRPRLSLRRAASAGVDCVHRGEREIIARD